MITNISGVISNSNILMRGYIERDGFYFTSLTYPYNIYDALIVRYPSHIDSEELSYAKSKKGIMEHIQLINSNQIEKAIIFAESIEFITMCPSLKYIRVVPVNSNGVFDFTPLYNLKEIRSLTCQTCDGENKFGSVDYKNIQGIVDLGVIGDGHLNYEKIETLRSLDISECKAKNLHDIFCSKKLDTLRMIQCGIVSLEGIEQSKNVQCIYMHHNRKLKDITALKNVRNTLKALRIENCPKIEDFSVLEQLEMLELLELSGKNALDNLSFIKKMKNLKTFVFNVNILDGDLEVCKKLPYVYCDRIRRHYNVKEKDLPKGNYIRGNENIEIWRRKE